MLMRAPILQTAPPTVTRNNAEIRIFSGYHHEHEYLVNPTMLENAGIQINMDDEPPACSTGGSQFDSFATYDDYASSPPPPWLDFDGDINTEGACVSASFELLPEKTLEIIDFDITIPIFSAWPLTSPSALSIVIEMNLDLIILANVVGDLCLDTHAITASIVPGLRLRLTVGAYAELFEIIRAGIEFSSDLVAIDFEPEVVLFLTGGCGTHFNFYIVEPATWIKIEVVVEYCWFEMSCGPCCDGCCAWGACSYWPCLCIPTGWPQWQELDRWDIWYKEFGNDVRTLVYDTQISAGPGSETGPSVGVVTMTQHASPHPQYPTLFGQTSELQPREVTLTFEGFVDENVDVVSIELTVGYSSGSTQFLHEHLEGHPESWVRLNAPPQLCHRALPRP